MDLPQLQAVFQSQGLTETQAAAIREAIIDFEAAKKKPFHILEDPIDLGVGETLPMDPTVRMTHHDGNETICFDNFDVPPPARPP